MGRRGCKAATPHFFAPKGALRPRGGDAQRRRAGTHSATLCSRSATCRRNASTSDRSTLVWAKDTIASNGGSSFQGLRDAAILRVMSDTLARISEVAALRCADVEADATGGGTVLIRTSKSDQAGRRVHPLRRAGHAVNRYLEAAGHSAGPLFRQVRRGGHAQRRAAGRRQHLRHIVRRRAAAAGRIGGHSLRIGSARELAADGASVAELQQAGGWKSPPTPGVSSGAKQPHAGRSLGTATRWTRGDNLGTSGCAGRRRPGGVTARLRPSLSPLRASGHRGGYTPAIPAAAGGQVSSDQEAGAESNRAGLPGPYGHRQPCGFQREKEAAPSTIGPAAFLSGLRSPDRHRDIKSNRLSQHGSIPFNADHSAHPRHARPILRARVRGAAIEQRLIDARPVGCAQFDRQGNGERSGCVDAGSCLARYHHL